MSNINKNKEVVFIKKGGRIIPIRRKKGVKPYGKQVLLKRKGDLLVPIRKRKASTRLKEAGIGGGLAVGSELAYRGIEKIFPKRGLKTSAFRVNMLELGLPATAIFGVGLIGKSLLHRYEEIPPKKK